MRPVSPECPLALICWGPQLVLLGLPGSDAAEMSSVWRQSPLPPPPPHAGALTRGSSQCRTLMTPGTWRAWVSFLPDPAWRLSRKNSDWCPLGHREPTPDPRTGPWGRGGWTEEGDRRINIMAEREANKTVGFPWFSEDTRPTFVSALWIRVPVDYMDFPAGNHVVYTTDSALLGTLHDHPSIHHSRRGSQDITFCSCPGGPRRALGRRNTDQALLSPGVHLKSQGAANPVLGEWLHD